MTDMTPKQIKAALEAGILTEEQAEAMRRQAKLASSETAALIGNEEDMRFVRSFSDVFIAMGIGILSLGVFTLCSLLGGKVAFFLGAGFMWMMAEYFGRKKRAHLPTLLIALSFLFFVHTGAGSVISVFPAFITLAAMLVFYWRFKLPFSIALIAISLVTLIYSFVQEIVPIGGFMLFSGFALFATALIYDARDTGRLTRFADNAFWLHFTAGPLILNGIALQILALKTTKFARIIPVPTFDKGDAVTMLIIIGILSLVGLAINRRALLVSSFGYAGFSLIMLIKGTGLDFGAILAATFLLLGGGIVFLGAGWHGARSAILKILPTSGIFAKIFPPEK